MADFIDRKQLIEDLNKFAPEHYSALVNKIITLQFTANVAEVKHGEWVSHEGYEECGECRTKAIYPHNYCPNCGAKMDGKGDSNG